MKFLSRAVLLAALAALPTAALAQDPIADRKAEMKKNGAAFSLVVKMTRGQEPYDSAKAKAAFETIAADLDGFENRFPAGSDKGDTRATAKIWEDMAGFKAAVTKAREIAKTNAEVAAKDADSLKTAVGAMGGQCQSCHDTYRRS